MNNVVSFKAKIPQEPDTEKTKRQRYQVFNYRAAWDQYGTQEMLYKQIYFLQLLDGALIAKWWKNDEQSFQVLMTRFNQSISTRQTDLELVQLPPYARGYVMDIVDEPTIDCGMARQMAKWPNL